MKKKKKKKKKKKAMVLRLNIRSANWLNFRLVIFAKKLFHHIQLHQREAASHF